MHLAVSEGQHDVVVVLLEKGARVDVVDTWGHTPLHDALDHNEFAIAQKLVAKGATVPAQQFALVMSAAQNDFAQLSLMCQRAGVSANSCDYDARSVLHVACSTGDLKAVQHLLRVGADVNIRDRRDAAPPDEPRVQGIAVALLLGTVGSNAAWCSQVARNAAGGRHQLTQSDSVQSGQEPRCGVS